MLWYFTSVVKSSDPMPGLFTISDPELQNIVKVFMKAVFKWLTKPNVIDLPGVSSSCYRDFLPVCQHQSPYSHCRVCSACETESENQKRTNLIVLEFTEKPKYLVAVHQDPETVSDGAGLNSMFTFCHLKWFVNHLSKQGGFFVCNIHFPKHGSGWIICCLPWKPLQERYNFISEDF